VPAADIAAYLGRANVAYKGGAAGLDQIAYQKWIALFNQETEAYSEWRRTNVPTLLAGPDVITAKVIPTRLPYPAIENSLNATNLKDATTRQTSADIIAGKVWWDK
jgi:hypothetical protein